MTNKLKNGDIVTGTLMSLKGKEWIVLHDDWFGGIFLVRNKGYSKWVYHKFNGSFNEVANAPFVCTRQSHEGYLEIIKDGEIERGWKIKMPRIMRWVIYLAIVVWLWRWLMYLRPELVLRLFGFNL